jgi:hypothetical protein
MVRLLIRATEPHDDLAGAIQRDVGPKSFFYRFLRPKHYLTDKEVASFVDCDFVSQVGLVGLVRNNLRMAAPPEIERQRLRPKLTAKPPAGLRASGLAPNRGCLAANVDPAQRPKHTHYRSDKKDPEPMSARRFPPPLI